MLYRGEEGQGKESKVTIEKLYELMKNMGNAINEHLNTMSETMDAKKKSIMLFRKLIKYVNKW